jgi:hypothetical protein
LYPIRRSADAVFSPIHNEFYIPLRYMPPEELVLQQFVYSGFTAGALK